MKRNKCYLSNTANMKKKIISKCKHMFETISKYRTKVRTTMYIAYIWLAGEVSPRSATCL